MAPRPAKRGHAKGTKKPKAKAPKPVKQFKAPIAKKGLGKTPKRQESLLETVLAENPSITSDEFAKKFNLPIEEVAKHKAFILQYTLDYNYAAAALRMGYPDTTAAQTGYTMLRYAYAQLFLMELQRSKTLETVVTLGQVVSKVWEEANKPDTVINGCVVSNSATRLKASELLLKMMGALNPKPEEKVIPIRRVMIVGEPALKSVNMDSWSNFATGSQKRLKASTVLDV